MREEAVRAEDERKETVAEGEVRMIRWLSRGADFGIAGTTGEVMV